MSQFVVQNRYIAVLFSLMAIQIGGVVCLINTLQQSPSITSPSVTEIKQVIQNELRQYQKNIETDTSSNTAINVPTDNTNMHESLRGIIQEELALYFDGMTLNQSGAIGDASHEPAIEHELSKNIVAKRPKIDLVDAEIAIIETNTVFENAFAVGVWSVADTIAVMKVVKRLPRDELNMLRDTMFNGFDQHAVEMKGPRPIF
jgi:hypothetical protein